jgi:putative transposase
MSVESDLQRREAVANFRYGLIAPVVTRELTPRQQGVLLREVAARSYRTPWGTNWQPSLRTLERYVAAYRTGDGWKALLPAARSDVGKSRVLSPEIIAQAVALRREVPSRSVQQVIDILVLSGAVAAGSIKRSTLHGHLERAGAGKREMEKLLRKETVARRFEAQHRNDLWMGDCQHTLHLPDPDNPDRRRQVYLLAFLDDYSRRVTHAEFYLQERLPKLEDCFKKAILRHGLPRAVYCDHGAIYVAAQFERICGELGVELIHSRPGRPQGRGKLEKWFQLINRSFLPEALALIRAGKLTTLDQLNELFWAWLHVGYDQRLHNATKQTPKQRWEADTTELRRVSPERLREVFVWQENRRVDKTGCVSLLGNAYEVDAALASKTVALRYDPYDLSVIQVWHDGRRFPDAVPLKLRRSRHRQVEPVPEPPPVSTGLNYLELLRQRQAEQQRQQLGQLHYHLSTGEGRP